MFCLILLISLIIGILLFDISLIGLSIFLSLLLVFLIYKYKNKRKILIISSISLIALGIIISNISFKEDSSYGLIGIVIKKKENYIILWTLKEKFYCYTNKDIQLFDVIKVDGYFNKLDFKEYESSFSFLEYLNKNEGVDRSLNINRCEIIINCPFDFLSYKEKVIDKFYSIEAKEFVSSLLFGESNSNTALKQNADKLMISNLLSTSGLFLNFLLYGLSKFFFLFAEKKQSRILSLIVLFPFFFFNIYRFSFVRVLIFFIVNIIIFDKQKYIDKFNVSIFIYLLILICNCHLIYNPGYYLPLLMSFMFKFGNLFIKSESKPVSKIKTKLIVCFTFLPYIINQYNGFNILGLFFNYTFTFLFKFLFLIAVISFYGIYIRIFDEIFIFFYKCIIALDFEMLDINIPSFGSLMIPIYYILFICILYFKEINFIKPFITSLVISTGLICLYIVPIKNLVSYEVSYINIGQGDSTLVRIKDKSFLIDTGGIINYDLATNSLIPFLKRKRIYNLEAVFITHYDYDHYGALESLNKNFNIKNIYDFNTSYPIYINGIKIDNLNENSNYGDANDDSLVLDFKMCNNRFLFMGDVSSRVEQDLLKKYDLKADYLKLAHHGSNSSSSLEFLKEVDPKVAIISCGKNNKFNHPNDEVINRLNYLNIVYRRTDVEGTISYQFYC